jgi:hypothetical protein
MRSLVSILIGLATAGVGYGQVGVPIPVATPVPFYGLGNSVIDHNGNLIVLDLLYSYATSTTTGPIAVSTVKTRVTVVAPDGTVKPPVEYPGTFQVLGAGWYAVYAILYTYPTVSGGTATRQLIAFNIVAGVPLSPLPTIDVPLRDQVQLSPARDSTGSDIVSFVDPPADPRIASPIARLARIIKYAGGLNFVAGTPIPLP